MQQLRREKKKTDCWTDVGDAVNGRNISHKHRDPPTRKDGVSSGHGICEQKGSSPGEKNSSVKSSDKEEDSNQV